MQRMTTGFRTLALLGALCGGAMLLSCGGRGDDGNAEEADAMAGTHDPAQLANGDPGPDETPSSRPSNVPVDPGAGPPPSSGGSPRIVEISTLIAMGPPASCTARFTQPLSDCTRGVYPYGIDCDGDGAWDYEVTSCDLSTAQTPPYFAGSFDCEPSDPTLKYWVTPDGDGDGFGTGAAFCAGPTIPPGYIALSLDAQYDCNDLEPNVHPNAKDTWGDGIDDDCSSDDLPACNTLVAGDTSFPHAPRMTEGCTDQPDLYLSSVATCGFRCDISGALYGFVGNAGGVSSTGPIELGYKDSEGREGFIEVVTEPLAPGAVSALFELPFERATYVSLWVSTSDCDNENQSGSYELASFPLCLR